MCRRSLLLTVCVVALVALLVFVFSDNRQKGEPQWTPPISDWKVNVCVPPC